MVKITCHNDNIPERTYAINTLFHTLLGLETDLFEVTFEESAKDYHIIAFWATWMANGSDFIWQLKNTLRDELDEGKVRVVAVSLDVEPYRWEDVIRPDSTLTNLEHYCDGLGFESQAVKTLSIDAVPFCILTDKNHKVLDCGSDVNKLAEVMRR